MGNMMDLLHKRLCYQVVNWCHTIENLKQKSQLKIAIKNCNQKTQSKIAIKNSYQILQAVQLDTVLL